MEKILILGAGPAGVSAALYAKRGGAEVTVIHKGLGTSALSKAEKIENYYGISPMAGSELESFAIEEAKNLEINFIEDELTELNYASDFKSFTAKSLSAEYSADSIIIAAGATRKTLKIHGIKEFEGHGVSYCATCDAFFYRKKTVAIVGAGQFAVSESEALIPHASKIYILTNGEDPKNLKFPENTEIITQKLLAVKGSDKVEKIIFEDNSEIPVDGIFIALGSAGSTDLARKLGVMLKNNSIKINEHMETNVPGIFAAGDAVGGMLQIAKAVYQGAEAGLSAIKYLRTKNNS